VGPQQRRAERGGGVLARYEGNPEAVRRFKLQDQATVALNLFGLPAAEPLHEA
jgi:hypothetical protein